MLGAKKYITPVGVQNLQSELAELIEVEMPILIRAIETAAQVDTGLLRKQLKELERKIRFLTDRLNGAVVVDSGGTNSKQVDFGARVTVRNLQGEVMTYTIVGVDEIDSSRNRISSLSPVGKQLLRGQVGDVIKLGGPYKSEQIEILKIDYSDHR